MVVGISRYMYQFIRCLGYRGKIIFPLISRFWILTLHSLLLPYLIYVKLEISGCERVFSHLSNIFSGEKARFYYLVVSCAVFPAFPICRQQCNVKIWLIIETS